MFTFKITVKNQIIKIKMETKLFEENDSWEDISSSSNHVSFSSEKNVKRKKEKNRKRKHEEMNDDSEAGKWVRYVSRNIH